MKIEHVAIYAFDLEKEKDFFVKYFNAKCNEKYVDGDFSSYFLTFEEGARLEIMSHKKLNFRPIKDLYNGISHIAISVGSKENVIAITKKIVDDGYTMIRNPRTTGDGYFESLVLDTENNAIEITE